MSSYPYLRGCQFAPRYFLCFFLILAYLSGRLITSRKNMYSLNIENSHARLVLLDFSLTVKAATLIFISGCGSAISSAKQEESGSIYNLGKN